MKAMAVDSTEKLDLLRSVGADHVIDYTQEEFTRRGHAYDVILDVVGKISTGMSRQGAKRAMLSSQWNSRKRAFNSLEGYL